MSGAIDIVCVIPLTQGKVTIVSPEDYELVSQWKWYATRRKHTWYAARKDRYLSTYMHIYITGFTLTDHENGDGLDNRRTNLREATETQNHINQGKILRKGCTASLFKGVSLHQNTSKWRAYIFYNGKQIHLGYFSEETDAAQAYDEAAVRYYKEFARTNKSLGLLG